MATSKYKGSHAEVWAEGYTEGVAAGQALAKREAEAIAPIIAAATATVARQAAISGADAAELDRRFGINQPKGLGSVVVGAIQQLGVPVAK